MPHLRSMSRPTYDADAAPPLCTAHRHRTRRRLRRLVTNDATAVARRLRRANCAAAALKPAAATTARARPLLGPTYEVRVFAHWAWRRTSRRVDACLNASGAVLPPQSQLPRRLALHSRLNDVIEWRPDVVLMMLGTNDAIELLFEKFGTTARDTRCSTPCSRCTIRRSCS